MEKINIIITLLIFFGCTKEESININDSDEFPPCGQGFYINDGKCHENECITERGYYIDDGVNGRFNRTEIRVQQNIDTNKNVGIFITYGQSNSCNWGEIGYSVNNEVFQFYNDLTYLYEDPSLGGTGTGGSVWGMLGDKLIENEIYDQVVFSITGSPSKTIEELSKNEYYEYFIGNYSQLLKRFGRVDGILFHQGESNRWTENQQYYNEFELFYNKLENDGICSPFYLSLVSYCGDGVDSTLLNIQNNIIIDFENILRGPNTDLLIEPQYRLTDNCHFSLLGYQQFSDMWVNCIINKSEI